MEEPKSQGFYSGREVSPDTYFSSSKTLSLFWAEVFCFVLFLLPLLRDELLEHRGLSVLFSVVSPLPCTVLGTE